MKKLDIDKSFLLQALEISKNSPALKRQVGAIILGLNNEILSVGWNHMFDELNQLNCENSKGESFECVIHAEADAINKLTDEQIPTTIYITYSPCMDCCKLIAMQHIKRVVFCNKHIKNFDHIEIENGYSPHSFLERMGIEVGYIPQSDLIKFNSKEKTALIYHSADQDGLMSAFLFDMIYQKEIENNSAKLIGYNYTKSEDWMNQDYTHFIFGDVTPTLEWLTERKIQIENREITVTIYDHHQQKHDDILSLEIKNINYIFYPQYSGAKIIYKFLMKKQSTFIGSKLVEFYQNWKNYSNELKICVDFISLYDTWKFNEIGFDNCFNRNDKFRFTKNNILWFHEYFELYRNYDEFKNQINILYKNFDDELDIILTKGELLQEKLIQENKNILKLGRFCDDSKTFIFEGYPNYYLPDRIYEKYPQLKYLIGFQYKLETNQISFSIRSETESNCDKIAKNFGGGGHSKSSGFKMTSQMAIEFIAEPKLFFTQCIPAAYINHP